ncbi:dephospho-CoA kinase [Lachnoclostridium sp.]|nr:dephospho-CoA kinase [Lachnoclostridium sp.]
MVVTMKVIGLTGGIGSGKSRVADLLQKEFSAYVIYTDDIARDQMKQGGCSYEKVVKQFGSEILDDSGEIDRNKLAKIIFQKEELVKLMNSLTHPNVHQEVLRQVKEVKSKGKLYSAIIVETALLFEAGYQNFCDEIWYVHAPIADRMKRLKVSRGYSEEKIESIIRKQKSEEFFLKNSTVIIENGNDVKADELRLQCKRYLTPHSGNEVRNK